MKVSANKKFLKDLANIPSKERIRIEQFVFRELPEKNSISAIHNLEKLSGYNQYFRIRFGNYRVGLRYENDLLVLERVLHRKEIYRYFP